MATDGQEKFIDQLLRETFEASVNSESSSSPRPLENQIAIHALISSKNFIRLEAGNFKLDFPVNWGPFEKINHQKGDSVVIIGSNDDWSLSEIFPLVDIYGPSWVFARISGIFYLLTSDGHHWAPDVQDIKEHLGVVSNKPSNLRQAA